MEERQQMAMETEMTDDERFEILIKSIKEGKQLEATIRAFFASEKLEKWAEMRIKGTFWDILETQEELYKMFHKDTKNNSIEIRNYLEPDFEWFGWKILVFLLERDKAVIVMKDDENKFCKDIIYNTDKKAIYAALPECQA